MSKITVIKHLEHKVLLTHGMYTQIALECVPAVATRLVALKNKANSINLLEFKSPRNIGLFIFIVKKFSEINKSHI